MSTILKECMQLNWNFQRGGRSRQRPRRYGHFLEHNALHAEGPSLKDWYSVATEDFGVRVVIRSAECY